MRYQKELDQITEICKQVYALNQYNLTDAELDNFYKVVFTLDRIIVNIDKLRHSIDGHLVLDEKILKDTPFHCDNFSDNGYVRKLVENKNYLPLQNNIIQKIQTQESKVDAENLDKDNLIETVKSLFKKGMEIRESLQFIQEAKNDDDKHQAKEAHRKLTTTFDIEIRKAFESDFLKKILLNGYDDEEREKQIIKSTVVEFINSYARVKRLGFFRTKRFVEDFAGVCFESRTRKPFEFSLKMPTLRDYIQEVYTALDNRNYYSILYYLASAVYLNKEYTWDEFAPAGRVDSNAFVYIDKFLREILLCEPLPNYLDTTIPMLDAKPHHTIHFIKYFLTQIPDKVSIFKGISPITFICLLAEIFGHLEEYKSDLNQYDDDPALADLLEKMLTGITEDIFLSYFADKHKLEIISFERDTRDSYSKISRRLFDILHKQTSVITFCEENKIDWYDICFLTVAEREISLTKKLIADFYIKNNLTTHPFWKKVKSANDVLLYIIIHPENASQNLQRHYCKKAFEILLAGYTPDKIKRFLSKFLRIDWYHSLINALDSAFIPTAAREIWLEEIINLAKEKKQFIYLDSWLIEEPNADLFLKFFNSLDNPRHKKYVISVFNENPDNFYQLIKDSMLNPELIIFLNRLTIPETINLKNILMSTPNDSCVPILILAIQHNNHDIINFLLENPVTKKPIDTTTLSYLTKRHIQPSLELAASQQDGFAYKKLLSILVLSAKKKPTRDSSLNIFVYRANRNNLVILPWASIYSHQQNVKKLIKNINIRLICDNLHVMVMKNMQAGILNFLKNIPVELTPIFQMKVIDCEYDLFQSFVQAGMHYVVNFLIENNYATSIISPKFTTNDAALKILWNFLEDDNTSKMIIEILMKDLSQYLFEDKFNFGNKKEESEVVYIILKHPNSYWRIFFLKYCSESIGEFFETGVEAHNNQFPNFTLKEFTQILLSQSINSIQNIINTMTFNLDKPKLMKRYLKAFQFYYQQHPDTLEELVTTNSLNKIRLFDVAVRMNLPKLVKMALPFHKNLPLDIALKYEAWDCLELLVQAFNHSEHKIYSQKSLVTAYCKSILADNHKATKFLHDNFGVSQSVSPCLNEDQSYFVEPLFVLLDYHLNYKNLEVVQALNHFVDRNAVNILKPAFAAGYDASLLERLFVAPLNIFIKLLKNIDARIIRNSFSDSFVSLDDLGFFRNDFIEKLKFLLTFDQNQVILNNFVNQNTFELVNQSAEMQDQIIDFVHQLIIENAKTHEKLLKQVVLNYRFDLKSNTLKLVNLIEENSFEIQQSLQKIHLKAVLSLNPVLSLDNTDNRLLIEYLCKFEKVLEENIPDDKILGVRVVENKKIVKLGRTLYKLYNLCKLNMQKLLSDASQEELHSYLQININNIDYLKTIRDRFSMQISTQAKKILANIELLEDLYNSKINTISDAALEMRLRTFGDKVKKQFDAKVFHPAATAWNLYGLFAPTDLATQLLKILTDTKLYQPEIHNPSVFLSQ